MAAYYFNMVSGDTLPKITGVLTGVNIAGYTINLHMKHETTGTVVSIAGTILNAALGTFEFADVPKDLTEGNWIVEVEVVDASTKTQSFRLNENEKQVLIKVLEENK